MANTRSSIKSNLYKDSVSLMRISQVTASRVGVKRVTLLMGTGGNKDFLAQAHLMNPQLEGAKPGDIMIVVEDESNDKLDAAEREIEALIAGDDSKSDRIESTAEGPPRSIARGVAVAEHANLALISVPGPYAAGEALKALRQGLNVLLFSDNVPIEEERAIKRVAERKSRLVMGPDCGTAIINGIPLGFANVIPRGTIGLVGASGTGLQEVMCQLHRLGQGVSQAIGTGSRDVYSQIGGSTMLRGLDLLANDEATRVIVIVSKPPAPDVQQQVLDRAAACGKPVVVCFLGGESTGSAGNVHHASSLEDAARKAAVLAGSGAVDQGADTTQALAKEVGASLQPSQRYIRGLYSGGTFCLEAQLIWRRSGIRARSNAPLAHTEKLGDGERSSGHTAIDLGSDEYTIGRPHPMIDYGVRIDRLLQEAEDPSVACIVLDVVLGYGSHPNPAEVLAPAIVKAKATARGGQRELPIICFVCGTEEDPQSFEMQAATLARAGVTLVDSSTRAAELASAIATQADVAAKSVRPRAARGGDR